METKKNNLRKNKKGVVDLILVIVSLVVIVISCAAIITVYKHFIIEADAELFQYNNDTKALKNDFNNTLGAVDYFIGTLWILMIIGAAIVAYQLRTAQYFIPIAVLILIIITVISAIMSNIWDKIRLSDSLSAGVGELGFSSFVLGYLPLWTIVIGCIILFVTYALGGDDENY